MKSRKLKYHYQIHNTKVLGKKPPHGNPKANCLNLNPEGYTKSEKESPILQKNKTNSQSPTILLQPQTQHNPNPTKPCAQASIQNITPNKRKNSPLNPKVEHPKPRKHKLTCATNLNQNTHPKHKIRKPRQL